MVDALGVGRLYWEPGTEPIPTFLAAELQWLDEQLCRTAGPAIVGVHCPTHAIPPEQTGLAASLHESPDAYGRALHAILDRHPQVRLVLSGHNHVSSAVRIHQRIHASVSAISEVPYQYLIVDADQQQFAVATGTLHPPRDGPTSNPAKSWVMGRPGDRAFTTSR